MNNTLVFSIIIWETRNWRHHNKAVAWCKDFGLKPITRQVYIGELRRKEMNKIIQHFKDIFVQKTEKFYFFSLCKSCYNTVSAQTGIKHVPIHFPPFEIIGKLRKYQ